MNLLTGLDEKFMREHDVREPPAFLVPFIREGGLLRRAWMGSVKTGPLAGLETLGLALRDRDDYPFFSKLLRANDWLPQSRLQWSVGDPGGSVFCMRRDDRKLWATGKFFPLDD